MAVVVFMVAACSLAVTTPAFAATTLYVAHSGSDAANNCQSHPHPCLTIGHALTEASGPTTIDLAAGIYPEQLTVDESNVTIDGAGAGTVIEPTSLSESDTATDSATAQAVILYVAPETTGVDLENLTVDGAEGNNFADPGNTDYLGVYYRDATGSITDVTVTDIEQLPAYFGYQPGANGGIEVATDSGATVDADVTMTDDTVDNYDKDGITCHDLATVCTIEDSTITGLGPIPTNAEPDLDNAQNGIEVIGASATIADDTVSGNSYTDPTYVGNNPSVVYTASGLLLENDASLTVEDNQVTGNDDDIVAYEDPSLGNDATPGTWTFASNNASEAPNNSGTVSGSAPVPPGLGLGDGIDVDGTTAPVQVTDNDESDDVESGTALYGSSNVSVEGNTENGDGAGIFVGGPGPSAQASTDDLISNNQISDSAAFGIDADSTAVEYDNIFDQNVSTGAATWDCLDQSTGAGTAGTANTWTADAGALSSPSALCHASDLFVTTTSLPGITEGRNYAAPLTATGGVTPYSWSISNGSLPPGLAVAPTTGVISGIATAPGTSSFTVTVTDATTPTPLTASAVLSITVAPPAPAGLYVSAVSPTSGLTSGDTPLVISGAGFTGASQVSFGASAGTGLTVENDSTILVDSPPLPAGIVDVTVTIPTGTSATSPADEFTYTVPANPTSVPCDPSCTDAVSTPLDATSVSATGSSGSSSLASTDLVVNTDELSCGSSFDYPTAVSTLSTTGFAPTTSLTVTETVGQAPSTKGMKVCFAAAGAATGTFLRPCKAGQKTACLKTLVENSGSVMATLEVPALDPRFWTGSAPPELSRFSPSAGRPGSTLTLKGKNMAQVNAVVVGGAQAVITKVTSSEVVATIPATATTGTVTIVSDAGVATSAGSFRVT